MSDKQTITLEGYEELLRKLDDPEWAYQPTYDLFESWGIATERQAKANIQRKGPGSWAGPQAETQKSLTHETVDRHPYPTEALVGSNNPKARWGEYGTGLLSEDPESSKKRHWPPASALDAWAARKKLPKYNSAGEQIGILTGRDVAAIIGLRGGIEPRRFLRNAAETTEAMIPKFLTAAARAIEREAERYGSR